MRNPATTPKVPACVVSGISLKFLFEAQGLEHACVINIQNFEHANKSRSRIFLVWRRCLPQLLRSGF